MRHLFQNILIASVVLSLSGAPMIVNAMPAPVPATQTDKKKAAEAKKKAAEKKKKEAEKAKAAKEKEKAAKEKAKAAEAKKKEAEKKKADQAKANAKAQAQRDKEAAERAKLADQRAQEKAQKEAEAQAKEEKALRDYEKYQAELENPKTEVISYFGLGMRIGYAAMMDKIQPTKDGALWGAGTLNQNNALQQLIGGGGAGLTLGYNLEYGHFLFETGLDFRFLNSTSNYGFQAQRMDVNTNARYSYWFDNMHEMRNMMQIGVPVMFGAQFNRFYFLAGIIAGYSLWSNYSQWGKYDVVVDDPIFMEPYGKGIHELNGQTNAPIKFRQPELSLAAEIGLDLDEWLQKQPTEEYKKKKVQPGQRLPFGRQHIHYRVALFAEYGVLNTNNTAAASPVLFDGQELIQKTNTMLAMNGDTKLNNLFVGAKFVVQFEVPGRQARPVPPPPAHAIYSIIDAETNEPLTEALMEVRNTQTGKIAMRERTIGAKGYDQKLTPGSFTAEIKAEGYYPATRSFTIEKVGDKEYITIALKAIPAPPAPEPEPVIVMPVKTGEVFIMKNLHFATNRTRILSSSEEALDMLYQHLAKNPELRIRIIGHTDNVGKDNANQKLSEGRANAVKKELEERGIAPERIEAEGRGESQPIDTNETEEGRQNNRRVEIEIL